MNDAPADNGSAMLPQRQSRHSMRERQIAQLSYPTRAVDNCRKRRRTACASILDNVETAREDYNALPGFRLSRTLDPQGYRFRMTLTFQEIIRLSTGKCNAC
jgi:hypothetical protein